ncbi:uncharacterized protein [Embiotoca jacksoni]|uniref:uncharacterized protein isoform X2 n=1 Tax=Embiotoca jacksoni TaxID=100190 RepID=UPI003704A6A3
MTLSKRLITFATLSTCIVQSLGAFLTGCLQRNVSCNDFKVINGYKFPHSCSEKIDISNKTSTIAHGVLNKPPYQKLPAVIDMDNSSVTLRDCTDFSVKCENSLGKDLIDEWCEDFKTTEETQNPHAVDLPTRCSLICSGSLGVIVMIVIVIVIAMLWSYISWKKKMKQGRTATVSGYFTYLLTCLCLSKRTSQPECREEEEIRDQAAMEVIGVLYTQHNGDISGHVRAPNVNGASHHRAMSRNMRDDPGGVKSNKRKDIFEETDGGSSVCDHNAGDHETEELLSTQGEMDSGRAVGHNEAKDPETKELLSNQRKMDSGQAAGDHDAGDPETTELLPNQRAAFQHFEKTGEAGLVDKHGFNPDDVSSALLH